MSLSYPSSRYRESLSPSINGSPKSSELSHCIYQIVDALGRVKANQSSPADGIHITLEDFDAIFEMAKQSLEMSSHGSGGGDIVIHKIDGIASDLASFATNVGARLSTIEQSVAHYTPMVVNEDSTPPQQEPSKHSGRRRLSLTSLLNPVEPQPHFPNSQFAAIKANVERVLAHSMIRSIDDTPPCVNIRAVSSLTQRELHISLSPLVDGEPLRNEGACTWNVSPLSPAPSSCKFNASSPSSNVIMPDDAMAERLKMLEDEKNALQHRLDSVLHDSSYSVHHPDPEFCRDWDKRTKARLVLFCSRNRAGNSLCAWHDTRRERREFPPRQAPKGRLNCGCTEDEALFEESLARHGIGAMRACEQVRLDSTLRTALLKLLQTRYNYKDGDFERDPTTGNWLPGDEAVVWEQKAMEATGSYSAQSAMRQ